ncbi:MAG: restriction endonuclease subunit S [Bacteroidales bacterium]|nr:restriction endonuclease subunit S [Bacteroidales bacterium]
MEKIKLSDVLIKKTLRLKDVPEIKDPLVLGVTNNEGVVISKIDAGQKVEDYFVIEKGDFVYNPYRINVGSIGISELNGITSLAYVVFNVDETKLNKYLLYKILKSDFGIKEIVRNGRGSVRNALRFDDLAKIELTLPPIEKQNKFIQDFKKKEEKIYKLKKNFSHQLSLLENLNQAILQEAVQGKLAPQNPNDEPATELLKRIKAEKATLRQAQGSKKIKELPPIKPEEIPFEIPENWVWCRLGEITNYGSSPKAEPTNLKNETWVLDLEDIEKTTSNLLCKIRFNERNSLSTKSVFKTGDVLYSKLRPYLDKVIVADEDGVCTTEILPLKCFANLNPFYLKYALKRADFLKYVNSKTKGMKMPRLGTKEGEIALIPLPPLSEQKRIVAEIERQFEKTKELKAHILSNQQATEQLLKALLQGAFEGEEKEN